jgi:NAD(P)-dependent dehydrogenase (short-subunit alcohol dehydrogenase family)
MIEMASSDQVILITGSTGIAAATACRASAKVFIAALERNSALDFPSFEGDLSDEATAEAAVQACLHHYGRIDGVFNVAGISGRRFGDGPLHECSTEGWDTLMRVNVRSLFLVTRAAIRHMLSTHRPGAIVNMGSVLADSPEPRNFATHAYAASKGAIVALTKSAAAYYAPHKIRINAVAPGLVETPMSRRAQENVEICAYIRTKQALSGGFLSADDVAAAALFLLSDDARHITGEVLTIDGGWRFGAA